MMKVEQIELNSEGAERFHLAASLIYENDPRWKMRPVEETVRLLDPEVNPYWIQASRALFVATKDGIPVGRIVAVHDPIVCSEHHSKEGFFGFFECVNDPEPASALFAAASTWLSKNGCNFLHGPFQPVPDFDAFGILVEGFDEAQVSGESFNPEYYSDLCTACGLQKENDFFAFESLVKDNPVLHERLARLEKILSRHPQAASRPFDLDHFDRDEELTRKILTRAFEDQPLYSELNSKTQSFLLQTLARPEDMHWFMIVEENGQPAGVNLLAPNYDDLLHGDRIKSIHTSELCILPEFQRSQAAARLMVDGWKKVISSGFDWVSLSYQHESHQAMHHMLESFGCRRYKRFRLYKRPL
jgi:hypothetical protein